MPMFFFPLELLPVVAAVAVEGVPYQANPKTGKGRASIFDGAGILGGAIVLIFEYIPSQ